MLPENRWPGRLVVGGKTLDDFVTIGEEASPEASWTIRVFQSVSEPTLQIRAQWRAIGPATEWISTLVNNSSAPSECVTELRSLAASWPTRGPVDFYGTKGGEDHVLDEFADLRQVDIDAVELSPEGGRSSAAILPFFALTDRHDSLAVGIGWSGQWCASIRHSAAVLQVEVGLPRVGFVLRPQESVRLPSVLLTRASGAPVDQARRLTRAHLTSHVVPKTPDGKSPNFTAHGPMHVYLTSAGGTDEARELAALERAAALGFETYWVDACWYGDSPEAGYELGNWDSEVGNWHVRRRLFPRGLRPISDRAHELGMKFLFWMDPERAQPNSKWVRTHPELFLSYPENGNPDPYSGGRGLVLNLGDPRAVDFAFKEISALITEFNADIFRNDFNLAPLDAWRAADAHDRVGITEIKCVEGLYELWDRLLAAHPGLLIDNCASGGRRIDLETTRRSIPYWRSDLGLAPGGAERADVFKQRQCWGLGHWLSEHSGPVDTFDAYAIRSALATGFMAYRELPRSEYDPQYANVRAAVAENKRLRPILAEERIGLIVPDRHKEIWAAFQYHSRSEARGIIVALRGPHADLDSVTLRPEHIDADATYEVVRWDDYYRMVPTARVAGAELQEMLVTIPRKLSSVLLEYQRVG
ncbi:hypothetical protein AXK11_09045 [Cephaloticoccus primus]|uniref:Alpha-galactosidase n=1 Tax=Cephaloticoccus primus TaxID=1548207 RepID=A0A139SHN9_9BACT|nr:hypothetical protein AXK11_09045 [Cephaloticoccus primus]